MAKPILVIDVSIESLDIVEKIIEYIKKCTDNEYHVIVRVVNEGKNAIQCFNDCKGLTDIDIEKLINDIKSNKA